jgi:hypothetical protein
MQLKSMDLATGRHLHRRSFLGASFALLAGGLASCVTTPKNYTEQVSSVLVSADGKKLVVVTPKFHYIFEGSPVLLQTLKADFHPLVRADVGTVHVSSNGKTSADITLRLEGASQGQVRSAMQAGYSLSANGTAYVATVPLRGQRYLAGTTTLPTEYKLNRTYDINVLSDQDASKTPFTPLQVVAFVPVIAGVALFGLTVLVGCTVTGQLNNCHE